MNVEIKKRSALRTLTEKMKSKGEDAALWILERIPERMMTPKMIDRMSELLDRRIYQLRGQEIKNTWRNLELEKAVEQIRENT